MLIYAIVMYVQICLMFLYVFLTNWLLWTSSCNNSTYRILMVNSEIRENFIFANIVKIHICDLKVRV